MFLLYRPVFGCCSCDNLAATGLQTTCSPEEKTVPPCCVPGLLAQGARVTELYVTHALLGSTNEDAFLV